MMVQRFVGFSEDGTEATIEVELKAGRRYQLVVGSGFTDNSDRALKPYLIDFTTAGQ